MKEKNLHNVIDEETARRVTEDDARYMDSLLSPVKKVEEPKPKKPVAKPKVTLKVTPKPEMRKSKPSATPKRKPAENTTKKVEKKEVSAPKKAEKKEVQPTKKAEKKEVIPKKPVKKAEKKPATPPPESPLTAADDTFLASLGLRKTRSASARSKSPAKEKEKPTAQSEDLKSQQQDKPPRAVSKPSKIPRRRKREIVKQRSPTPPTPADRHLTTVKVVTQQFEDYFMTRFVCKIPLDTA